MELIRIEERAKLRRWIDRLTVEQAINQCFKARKAEAERRRRSGTLDVSAFGSCHSQYRCESDRRRRSTRTQRAFQSDLAQKLWATSRALNRINLTPKHAAALGLDVDQQACLKTRALLGKQRHNVEHIFAIPYRNVPAFFQSLYAESGIAALALRFLILTAARTSEVRLATFDEIEGDVWSLDASRTKNGRAHSIPLSRLAAEVVASAQIRASNVYLFASYRGKPLSDAAMSKLMRDRDLVARPHGFRASFRTWLEEQTDTPFEIKESALGHHVDAGVVGAYQRSDRLEKRRTLMHRWAEFLRC